MERYCELTNYERQLLEKHKDFYEDLNHGRRKPTTEAQKHFLLVCRGQAPPETEHEFAYMHFLMQEEANSVAQQRYEQYHKPDRILKSRMAEPPPLTYKEKLVQKRYQEALEKQKEHEMRIKRSETATPSIEKKKLDHEAYLAALERKRERDHQTGGIPEYEEGAPRSEFGTRDEYKKMRGRDFSDIRKRRNE